MRLPSNQHTFPRRTAVTSSHVRRACGHLYDVLLSVTPPPRFDDGDNMNIITCVSRQALRSPAIRRAPWTIRAPYTRLSTPFPYEHTSLKAAHILRLATAFHRLPQHRGAASSVSGRPGSQTIEQAAQNVREEVGNSTTDWAKAIAGGNFTVDSVKPPRQTFVSAIINMYISMLSVGSLGSRALSRIQYRCRMSCLGLLAVSRTSLLQRRRCTCRTRQALPLQVC